MQTKKLKKLDKSVPSSESNATKKIKAETKVKIIITME